MFERRRGLAATASLLIGLLGIHTTGCSSSCAGSEPAPDPHVEPGAVGRFVAAEGRALTSPARIAIAPDGTLFVSDARSDQVIGFSGGKPVIALEGLAEPLGLAVAGGRLYVGNAGRKDVEVYDLAERKYLRSLGAGAGAFELPNAIAAGPDGKVYVTDSKLDRIGAFEPDGTLIAWIGESGSGDGQLRFPSPIAVDADRIVVGDQGNHRVVVFDRRNGAFVRAFGGEIPEDATDLSAHRGRFTRIQGLALRGDEVHVLDSVHGTVQVLDLAGESRGFYGRLGTCESCLGLAADLALDNDGRALVTDPDRRRWLELPKEMR